jgi:glycosidase
MSNFGDKPMVRFNDSQDKPRFVTSADYDNNSLQNNQWDTQGLPKQPTDQRAYDRLFSAVLDLVTIPGVPLIYYGTEYGEYGASDPDNRHMLRTGNALDAQETSQLARTTKLLKVRSSLRGLGRGTLLDMWCNTNAWGSTGGDLMAFARVDIDPKQSAVVVLNLEYDPWDATSKWGRVVVNFPQQVGWTSGTVVDALSDNEWSFSGSSATVDVPARGGVILRLK